MGHTCGDGLDMALTPTGRGELWRGVHWEGEAVTSVGGEVDLQQRRLVAVEERRLGSARGAWRWKAGCLQEGGLGKGGVVGLG